MSQTRPQSFWIIGFALFSMFFGSGNLVYPLFVGKMAGHASLAAIIGFLLTGVLFPFLGVITMILYDGDYKAFFSVLGKRGGFLLTAVLLTVWIPLGSAPRCTTVAYASLTPYVSLPPMWVFSALYSLLVYVIIRKKGRMIDILGYILTPVLIFCLSVLLWHGISLQDVSLASLTEGWSLFGRALQEGYNTMDLIAAFFFTASIINLLRQGRSSQIKRYCGTTFRACFLGMILLGVFYVGFILLAAEQSTFMESVPKDQLLTQIGFRVMGPYYGFVGTVAILLACFTTSVALVLVFYEFLLQTSLPLIRQQPHRAIALTLCITFGMSIFGLEGIAFVTGPVLRVCYPFLVGLMIFQQGRHAFRYFQKPQRDVAPAPSPELR